MGGELGQYHSRCMHGPLRYHASTSCGDTFGRQVDIISFHKEGFENHFSRTYIHASLVNQHAQYFIGKFTTTESPFKFCTIKLFVYLIG